jgi:hypothetical protein
MNAWTINTRIFDCETLTPGKCNECKPQPDHQAMLAARSATERRTFILSPLLSISYFSWYYTSVSWVLLNSNSLLFTSINKCVWYRIYISLDLLLYIRLTIIKLPLNSRDINSWICCSMKSIQVWYRSEAIAVHVMLVWVQNRRHVPTPNPVQSRIRIPLGVWVRCVRLYYSVHKLSGF